MAFNKSEVVLSKENVQTPLTIECYVIDQLPIFLDSIKDCFQEEFLQKLKSLQLADTNFKSGGYVEFIIGSNLFWDLILPEQIRVTPKSPILQKTKLGWVVVGNSQNVTKNSFLINYFAFEKVEQINSTLKKFWEIEECSINSTEQLNECEILYNDTTQRASDGRLMVELPFKENPTVLGDSYKLALKRFYLLERKLRMDKKLKLMYTEFMKEYKSLGHMTKVPSKLKDEHPCYYIPHLGVLDESRLTTKLRVVFDASAKSSSNKSLNDILRVGPTIQDTLFSILIRFREYPIVIAADITKMYRQVWIVEQHRKFQRILWRDDDSKPIEIYQLNTVTYGTGPASFLATRSLTETGKQNSEKYPLGSKAVEKDFYVDDFLSGGEDSQEAKEKKKQVEEILKPYGFYLRKWISNDQGIFKNEEHSEEPFYLNPNNESKILGIQWQSVEDEFFFKITISVSPYERKITKRNILSESSKMFDPLGFVSPIIIRAKFLLQQLWQEKLDWDEPVAESLQETWKNLKQEFVDLKDLKIPRHLNIFTQNKQITIHGFSDASKKGYGACIYLINNDQSPPTSRLICSKSRVAPIKPQTLPKLELCAALTLSELTKNVLSSMSNTPLEVHLWSDSCIVLCWLQNSAKKWQTFVSNRVSVVQENTENMKGNWHYVPSKQNPADLISRGVSTKNLINSNLWWYGPNWITSNRENWPEQPASLPFDSIPEANPNKTILLLSFSVPLSIIQKFSSFTKMYRVFAWCLRYITNLRIKATEKRKEKRITFEKLKEYLVKGPLSINELQKSIRVCIASVQTECFAKEMNALKENKEISKSSNLKALHPFLDENSIIRVGGRLHNSALLFHEKHPMLLPPKHALNNAIFLDEHLRNLHAPPQLLLSSVRQRFWPIKGMTIAKKIVSRCVPCAKVRSKFCIQKMGPLPVDRVSISNPFSVSGIDYAGPIYLKSSSRKNSAIIKAYVCIFICLSLKAVHFEVVTSLTATAFLRAFKRFSSRRGLPIRLYSDNSKTFEGANNLISRNFDKIMKCPEVSNYFTNNQIEWKFNAPYSPHLGGLWEAGIKSFKRHFRITTRSYTFTFEEAETLMIQIEAVLNSRPLTPLSTDPHDLEVLTPGHFLIGRPIKALPFDFPCRDENQSPLDSWKKFKGMIDTFWSRWHSEYLQQLQKSSKWYESNCALKEGSLVIIKMKNVPPSCWNTARIMKLHYGTDGRARLATLLTSTGTTSRSITELCLLPNESN